MIYEYRGTDANKRVNGRKRHVVVDTHGRLWVAAVHLANQGDGPAADSLIGDLFWRVGERLEKVYNDQSYNGVFASALADWHVDFEQTSQSESAKGFVPVPKRWVVEPIIAWTNRSSNPVLPTHCQRLRIYNSIFGQLAVFSQHSTNASADINSPKNIISQHVPSLIMPDYLMRK